jgi:predicted adenylyl cyclase CyaB
MKEIEILIEVKSTKEDALKALEQFDYQGIKKTLDVYFSDPLRKDLQPDEQGRLAASFRLRTKNGKNSLAYKVDHFNDSEWSHSDEYETSFDDLESMSHIIEKLGLIELIRIDNEKHIFLTTEYEIVLEDVKDLGLFMEVEKLAQVPDDKVAATKQEIRTFLQSLDIEFREEQNAGKPELMLHKGNKD